MFTNYLKTALRSLRRNRNFTIINIAGLAAGIAVCLLIFIIIQYQTSFDNFHPNGNRIYRVLTEYHHDGAVSYRRDVPFPLPAALKTSFPQIEAVAPIFASHDDKLLIPDENGKIVNQFKEKSGLFITEPSFFTMFHFPLLAGSYESLKEPDQVLLTREIAEKYFGNWKSALGKTLKLELGGYIFEHGTDVLTVSGILADIPANTDFPLKLVVSYGTGASGSLMAQNTDWEDRTNSGYGCFIMLSPSASINQVNEQLRSYSAKVESANDKDSHVAQPLGELHYDVQTGNYSNQTISKNLIHVLWLIAAFILLIACVNFINLSTAQAVNRAKEVAVRKVLGSNKYQLKIQFLLETFLIVTGSVIIAFLLSLIALPYINHLLELSLSFQPWHNPAVLLFLVAVIIAVTLLAGFYPSMVLSRFNPVSALKSKIIATSAKGISLRRGLVVFQFIIAQVLIIGTLVIIKQMSFFMDQPLGFDKEAIINVPFRVDSAWFSKADYLRQQLLSVNGVKAVSFSSNAPMENDNDMWSTFTFDHAAKEADFKVITKFADDHFASTYQLPIIAGRNLKPSGFTQEFLVNETLAKQLGFNNPEEILNKQISIWGDKIKCPVVGVLKDFNDRSLRDQLAPLLITTNVTMYSQAGIKLETNNLGGTLQSVKQIWQKVFPDFVYSYSFLDDKIAGFYKQEEQLSQLYKLFAAIAIFLSCLGLYGLASFMAVQKIKEVGIRKVLGASAGQILYLFSREFILLIGIAFAIATPIAWYFMHQWLQDYAYRITMSWWLFASGGAAALFIALATISFQSIKAALANPVKSLRSE